MSGLMYWAQVLAIVAGVFLAGGLIAHYIVGFKR